MAREKIIQARIVDDDVRRNTLKKRRNGLWKKINEFTTLCDVEACAVVYGPHHDAEPEVWPNVPEATTMLQSFQELPEFTQCKKMMNQEAFLEEKLTKTIQQYQRLENQIQKMEDLILIYEFMSGRDMDELDLQEARKAYYIAGSRQKMGYEQMENTMAVQGSSSEGVNYPPLTKTDYYLDDAIASYVNELIMQYQNQIVSSNFNHQNQLSVPNFNQTFMIQQPVINYVENRNQILMHQQANVGSSSNNMVIASYVNQPLMVQQSVNGYIHNPYQAPNVQNESQAMASSAGGGHQHLANMEEDRLWMNPAQFG